MSLEKIVGIAYKATLPVRKTLGTLDGVVKIAYDAVVDATGIGRHTLALLTGIGGGAALASVGVGSLIFDKATVTSIAAVGGGLGLASSYLIRSSFPLAYTDGYIGKIHSQDLFTRLIRLPLLVGGVYGIFTFPSQVPMPSMLYMSMPSMLYMSMLSISNILLASSFYLSDDDHSPWDKIKDKARQAYWWIKGKRLVPNLNPEPAISYNVNSNTRYPVLGSLNPNLFI